MITKKLRAASSPQNMREQRLSLRQFRVLLAIADHGSITSAANKLNVTQTAVSKSVAEVDDILGVPMLERRGRRVVLSAAGEQVVTTGRRINAEVRVLLEDIELLTDGAMGSVRIGIQAIEPRLLADCIAEFKRSRPLATVSVREAPVTELMRDLRAGTLEFVYGRVQSDQSPAELESVTTKVSDTVICATVGNPALDTHPLTWREAVKHTWCVAMKGIPSRDHLESVLLQSGLDFPASYVEFSAAPMMMLVMEKLTCLMALPESLAHSLSERGLVEITNLRLPTLLDNFGLIWNKQIALGPSAQAFRNTFVTQVEQHSGRPVVRTWLELA